MTIGEFQRTWRKYSSMPHPLFIRSLHDFLMFAAFAGRQLILG
ncbi:hypothetical protein RLPCCGM1_p0853 [Rhizobium leguminosarum bv. phaseoli CCGM1]|nr:hypothetical protein RLPCCGM1_p0853 [Rhizobium leguminosarum bv. phaseoli CCGM1]